MGLEAASVHGQDGRRRAAPNDRRDIAAVKVQGRFAPGEQMRPSPLAQQVQLQVVNQLLVVTRGVTPLAAEPPGLPPPAVRTSGHGAASTGL